jgi:aryl-alcohol dehydrogenase-like predicted oxidoreductase
MNRRDALRLIAASAALGVAVQPGVSMGADVSQSILSGKIPSSGEMLPVVGLGTWQTFDVDTDVQERKALAEVLREFVALGGKLIDSSPMYGSSESVVGDLTRQLGLRQQLFVATKVWTSGKRAGIEQMEDSMQKLRAKPVDLMQVHNLLDVETQLETLDAWKREGRVRYVGVTHYHAGAHADVARVVRRHPVDFIQINYSVAEREAEQQLLPLARERGIAVIVNRPFAGGDIFRRIRSKPLPAWSAEIDCSSWAQIMLKFVLSQPAVTCAIPATSKVSHLRDNMMAGRGRMPDEAMRARIATEIA